MVLALKSLWLLWLLGLYTGVLFHAGRVMLGLAWKVWMTLCRSFGVQHAWRHFFYVFKSRLLNRAPGFIFSRVSGGVQSLGFRDRNCAWSRNDPSHFSLDSPLTVPWLRRGPTNLDAVAFKVGHTLQGLHQPYTLNPTLNYHNLTFSQVPSMNPTMEFIGTLQKSRCR